MSTLEAGGTTHPPVNRARRPRPARVIASSSDDDALFLTSSFITGVVSQALANEPWLEWGEGRFAPLLPTLLNMLPARCPPRRKK